jgi:UrcA family protein
LFVAALSGNGAAVAAGASWDGAPSVRVSYAGLDLTSDQGARMLYQRIASAAERVCAHSGTRDLGAYRASRVCERKAIAQAIEQVGNPKVAAILAETTGRS